jgi:hypothetical protein
VPGATATTRSVRRAAGAATTTSATAARTAGGAAGSRVAVVEDLTHLARQRLNLFQAAYGLGVEMIGT